MNAVQAARILVISPNWIGDAVMAQPLLQLLKKSYPLHAIDVLATPPVSPVWRAMAEVDTVLETSFRHGELQLKERWKLARQLKQRGYDQAYVLPNTLKFALIPWLACIRKRVGYLGEKRYGLLNVIHHDDKSAPRAMVAFYAALAAPVARDVPLAAALPKPRLTVSNTEAEQVMAKFGLVPQLPLVVFAPGAEFGSAKRWPEGHFAQLAQSVQAAMGQVQIVLLGAVKDRLVTAKIVQAAPGVASLAGETSLGEAIALIARAGAVVSNDSGLLHIASALNRPVVALYGPTDPGHAPPFSDIAASIYLNLSCAPCRQRECPLQHHKCMVDMSPGQVWQTLQPMLPASSN